MGCQAARRDNHHVWPRQTLPKTGTNRAVIRRLRRNGRLPAWVCAELVDTRVANRQDLLVELSIKIEGKPIEEAVAMAKDLVGNPPKYGPRTTPKAAPADQDVTDPVAEPDVKAPAETLVPVTVEDWTLFTSDGGEHWLRDLDLAEKAELRDPHDIRTTIQKALADGLMRDAMTILGGAENGPLVHEVKVQVAIGSGAKRWVPEYYLNEEAALLLVTRLRTPRAIELTKAIVRVFLAVVRGEVLRRRTRRSTMSVGRAAASPPGAPSEECHRALRSDSRTTEPLLCHETVSTPSDGWQAPRGRRRARRSAARSVDHGRPLGHRGTGPLVTTQAGTFDYPHWLRHVS